MRNFTTRIYTKANYLLNRGRMALSNQRGDFYISDAVKIIIAVVLGALLLAALTLIFNDTVIEVMKSPFRGSMGHIGFRCWNVERSLKYLETLGFRAVPETVKIEKGRVTVAYLDREVGGFAIHLVRAK